MNTWSRRIVTRIVALVEHGRPYPFGKRLECSLQYREGKVVAYAFRSFGEVIAVIVPKQRQVFMGNGPGDGVTKRNHIASIAFAAGVLGYDLIKVYEHGESLIAVALSGLFDRPAQDITEVLNAQ